MANIRETQGEEYELFRLIRAEQYRREPHILLETIRALSLGEVTLDVSSFGREVSKAGGRECDPGGYGGLCLDRRVEDSLRRGRI